MHISHQRLHYTGSNRLRDLAIACMLIITAPIALVLLTMFINFIGSLGTHGGELSECMYAARAGLC